MMMKNGENDGFLGVGFNNITLEEFTFHQDATYTVTRTNVDAEEVAQQLLDHRIHCWCIQIETALFDNNCISHGLVITKFRCKQYRESSIPCRVVDISLGRPEVLLYE